MKLVFDEHTFLWWDNEIEKLSPAAQQAFEDEGNTLFLSLVSEWEMQIKYELGKLSLRLPLPDLVREQQELNGIQLLPIRSEHIYQLSTLPQHHRDPFDRLLIAQAQVEDLILVTDDQTIPLYNVKILT
ncbi:MAG: type II toxin-antitoxin system VapC family toxin [bacterium]|jgi:PIN domain nuclease of toxin-antitoxin system